MTRQQRFKHEMFVRVRDFGAAHAVLFPESSKGGQAFARVSSAVAEIDEHMKNHVLGRAGARRVKAATRGVVYEYMKTIAMAARRVTEREPGASPFRMPRHRSLSAELATARAFIEEAATRQAAFEQFGLPPTFISDFRTLVHELQQAADARISSKTVRRKALAGIKTVLAQGLDAARDLDVIVAIAARQDPTTFAAWRSARRIEGQRSGAVKQPVMPVVPTMPSSDAAPMAGDSVAAAAVPLPSAPTMRSAEPLRELGRAS